MTSTQTNFTGWRLLANLTGCSPKFLIHFQKTFATIYDKIQDYADFFSFTPSRTSPYPQEGPEKTQLQLSSLLCFNLRTTHFFLHPTFQPTSLLPRKKNESPTRFVFNSKLVSTYYVQTSNKLWVFSCPTPHLPRPFLIFLNFFQNYYFYFSD
mmetsp:Transcript_33285/g.65842  ORF Transcript_33285/g.65842 Transcript_33285/m.65842 type:complete len:153 (+) Transcript_33285:79-537(+)